MYKETGVDERIAALQASVEIEDSSYAELMAIPLLGEVRAKYLAAAGIMTLADIRSAGEDELAAVKWIGAGNARRIKVWLAENPEGPSEPVVSSSTTLSPDEIGPDLNSDDTAAEGEPSDSGATPLDLPQEIGGVGVVDEVGQIDTAIHLLQEALPKKSRAKKLGKQLTKVANTVSAASSSFDELDIDDKQAAVKALDRIAQLLSEAVESGKLTEKKQEAMGDALKKHRKRLNKALGG